jgi:hypothetical protein
VVVGSLFSGAGLLDKGLHDAGIRHAWFVEREPERRDLLAARWPGRPICNDVRLVGGSLPPLNKTEFAEARALYESGLSLEAVAERFPVTRQALWERMKRAGVDMRPQQRHGEDNHFYRGGSVGEDWAHNKVEKAIVRGEIVRPSACSECGSEGKPYTDGRAPIQAHHDDYNKPLDVRWLCQPCHHEWHKHNAAVPLVNEPSGGDAHGTLFDLTPVDAIVGGFPRDRARALPTPARALVSTILRLLSGPSSRDSFASYNPGTSRSRTWRQSALSILEPSGEPFSGTWPRWGMTWHGDAFELPTWEPRTDETESSPSLATPTAWLGRRRSSAYGDPKRWHYPARSNELSDQIAAIALLPTPHGMAKEGQKRRGGPTGNELGRALTLLPTPVAGDGREKGGGGRWNKDSAPLEQTIKDEVKLLPTPRADPRDATPRTPREDWRPSLS